MITRLGSGEWVEKSTRQPCSLANNQKLAEHILIKGCTDVSFAEMHVVFLAWFPMGVAV